MGLEDSIRATPVQEQEEMDVTDGQGAAVPNLPTGETVPGLHEQQPLDAQKSQELLGPELPETPREPQPMKDIIVVDAPEAAPATPSRARREEPAEDSAHRDRSRDRERVKGKSRDRNRKKEEEEGKD